MRIFLLTILGPLSVSDRNNLDNKVFGHSGCAH
jgi:hypothetical protein